MAVPTPTPTFLGDFETETPPYAPFNAAQAHNYANPTDTVHANFGDFFRDPTIYDTGHGSGKFVVYGSDYYTAHGRTLAADGFERVQVTRKRTTATNGTHEFFTYSFKFKKGTTFGSNCVLIQPNWPNLLPPGVAFVAKADHVTLYLAAGLTNLSGAPAYQFISNADGAATNTNINLPAMYARPPGTPLELGEWHQFVLHVYWSSKQDGVLECWHRLKGTDWAKTAEMKAGKVISNGKTTAFNGAATLQTNKATGVVQAPAQDVVGIYQRRQQSVGLTMWADRCSVNPTLASAFALYGTESWPG